MIIPVHTPLPVSSERAVNALADRGFISECIDGIALEHGLGDELFRGTFTLGDDASEVIYHFTFRLVDFDTDGRSLSYEASAHEIGGRGLASLFVDLEAIADGATSTLVAECRLEMAGMGDNHTYPLLEQAAADRLVAFGGAVAAALAVDPSRAWPTPGASAHPAPEPARAAAPSTTALDPRAQRALVPIGAAGAATALAYVIWRVVRAGRTDGRSKGATS